MIFPQMIMTFFAFLPNNGDDDNLMKYSPAFPQSWCVLPWQPSEVAKTGGRP